MTCRRAGVSERAVEEIREKVGKQLAFLEFIGSARPDEVGPVLEFGLAGDLKMN